MKITTARRIAQAFFLVLFVWLGVVATVGTQWTQWRGWPIAWFLQLDPLVALGTVLSTHSLHPALGWALATVALTILCGRVFCGFVCPFGTLHQAVGWIARRSHWVKQRLAGNVYRPAQAIKYYILVALLAASTGNLLFALIRASRASAAIALLTAGGAAAIGLWLAARKIVGGWRPAVLLTVGALAGWAGLAFLLPPAAGPLSTLQIGWLDPISLLTRSLNLVLLPLVDLVWQTRFPNGRFATGVEAVGALFVVLLLLNLIVPRFFCRILCPLGALLGLISRGMLWSVGKTGAVCNACSLCDVACEGACNPEGPIRMSECLMCMNCLDACPTAKPIGYVARPSPGGEELDLGVTRRGFVATVAAGLAVAPLARMSGSTRSDWAPGLVRPPGAVAEEEFLARCLKCTACMRVCPTNVLQPAGFMLGWEGVWTPVLNNRIGTSGCQLNCIACGHACPTGAIRPLALAEKQGTAEYAAAGAIRIGLAAVDRGRCLPWANQRPCIVCEENCPVTPKAITVSEACEPIRDGIFPIAAVEGTTVRVQANLVPGRFGSGDYVCRFGEDPAERRILSNTSDSVTLDSGPLDRPLPRLELLPAAEDPADEGPAPRATGARRLTVLVRLQRPVVDPERCIGCGVCEHECPLNGLRAIRVTADNESRHPGHGVLLRAAG
jgi:polyferredoxin/formate hydrogenlyase subunit 6/NADH:ubiquinone oxidoreductase subunit I